jgi:hypothetical protein
MLRTAHFRRAPKSVTLLSKRATLAIADIYVPVKRRATMDPKRMDEIAASILDKGLQAPILVRTMERVS